MPLNAAGWTTAEDEKLIELVKPHKHLYYWLDPSRKNILTRERTWQDIAKDLLKPVEECKKRWRGLRDGYTRNKRMGAIHKSKQSIFEKLQFLDSSMPLENPLEVEQPQQGDENFSKDDQIIIEEKFTTEQNVITDNQEYYEITLVDGPHQEIESKQQFIKIIPKRIGMEELPQEPPKKMGRKKSGRKKSIPMPRNIQPVKILPKPAVPNGPRIIHVEGSSPLFNSNTSNTTIQQSDIVGELVEKLLKESTNEIDVFFRSMAASVKKLQPSLIPKVKMEVCNVIAKYEMLDHDKTVFKCNS